jgi:hypothetical protein
MNSILARPRPFAIAVLARQFSAVDSGIKALSLVFAGWLLTSSALAQQLEPRAYSPNPVGVNFLALSYFHSEGGVVFDPALPVEDVEATLDSAALGYGRTFGVWNRLASFAVAAPYIEGEASGAVGGTRGEVHRSGPGDAYLRLSMNVLGAPALSPEEFARRPLGPTLGASLRIVAPTGQYDPSRIINLGSNRWAFKPEIGVSYPIGHWFLEAYAGVWLFTDNDNYLGLRRTQDAMPSLQAHLSYTFRRSLWVALNATHYEGGRTHVGGVARADRQSNTRIGLTLSFPLGQRQSLKVAWSEGASVRAGNDFSTVAVAWQYAWFD